MMHMDKMQNQSNSKEINIEEIIKPFKEIIIKLQDEINEKESEIAQLKSKLMQYDNANKTNQQSMNNNMGQMNMMNNNMGQMNMLNQINPMNNNGNQMNMNMINNPFNIMNNRFNMMNNQMNQMINMGNQINVMGNEKLPRMGMGYESQDIKNLSIKVIMEKGKEIIVQCKSNDKMKKVINNFCIKSCIGNVEDYYFFIIKEEKAKLDSSVEQNEIKQKDYILAKKKLVNNKENQSLNDKKEQNSINDSPVILGKPIYLMFVLGNGVKVNIQIGLNNTIKDALIKFCNKFGLSISCLGKDLGFLFNASFLDYEDNRTLGEIGIIDCSSITVLDRINFIGA